MVSAQVRIDGYMTEYPEFLSISYEHPDILHNVSPYVYFEA